MGTRTSRSREQSSLRLTTQGQSRYPCTAHPHIYISTPHKGFLRSLKHSKSGGNPMLSASPRAALRFSSLSMSAATSQGLKTGKPREHSRFPHFLNPLPSFSHSTSLKHQTFSCSSPHGHCPGSGLVPPITRVGSPWGPLPPRLTPPPLIKIGDGAQLVASWMEHDESSPLSWDNLQSPQQGTEDP